MPFHQAHLAFENLRDFLLSQALYAEQNQGEPLFFGQLADRLTDPLMQFVGQRLRPVTGGRFPSLPRPGPIQEWVVREGLALPSVERYKRLQRYYARDKGRTMLREILDLMEIAA